MKAKLNAKARESLADLLRHFFQYCLIDGVIDSALKTGEIDGPLLAAVAKDLNEACREYADLPPRPIKMR